MSRLAPRSAVLAVSFKTFWQNDFQVVIWQLIFKSSFETHSVGKMNFDGYEH
jgi:hypothetical protein